ncbi:MAG: 23S rRNA (adenine(2503)-C(2))-methyltransferase RlmN [Planctomycetales bacterium]|nr:23S rRNA (adenine(2503)-C(2))-methyltransferase RlmN [Planctomycetales bacterium]
MSVFTDILSLTLSESEDRAVAAGMPRFRGKQIWEWAHRHRVSEFSAMTNLPSEFRQAHQGSFRSLTVDEIQVSIDGTRKVRFVTHDGHAIESVLIPVDGRVTQCVSSQVGCALGCEFCATAKLGLTRNLEAAEIVEQMYRGVEILVEAGEGAQLTNIVYMGMGEPLHNYENVIKSLQIVTSQAGLDLSARRITVSTVGMVPAIEKLGRETRVRPCLAISLNASNDLVRDQIMPINRKYNIKRLLDTIAAFPLERRRAVTFEYVLLEGVNDSLEDARRVAGLLKGLRAKLNIIA